MNLQLWGVLFLLFTEPKLKRLMFITSRSLQLGGIFYLQLSNIQNRSCDLWGSCLKKELHGCQRTDRVCIVWGPQKMMGIKQDSMSPSIGSSISGLQMQGRSPGSQGTPHPGGTGEPPHQIPAKSPLATHLTHPYTLQSQATVISTLTYRKEKDHKYKDNVNINNIRAITQ